MKRKWYDLEPIKKLGCRYNIIFGQRSNGKTYALLREILKNYRNGQGQGALIRRYLDEIRPTRRSTIFAKLIKNGEISKLFADTPEQWTTVRYNKHCFWLAKPVEDKKGNVKYVTDENPFMYVFALTEEQDIKETSYPDVTTIFFDEFISRTGYLSDEFTLFVGVLSTIIREKEEGVKIYLVGNTISQYCPYFKEMGLTKVAQIPLGKIQVYSYGETSLKVAVEHADNAKTIRSKKDVNPYFAFDNPHLKRITHGDWELDIYPHLRTKFFPKDIQYKYFINWDGNTYEGDIVEMGDLAFTFIHIKTTPIQDVADEIVFQKDACEAWRYRSKLTKPLDDIGKTIYSFFLANKVFYQDNSVGDAINNYLIWSDSSIA